MEQSTMTLTFGSRFASVTALPSFLDGLECEIGPGVSAAETVETALVDLDALKRVASLTRNRLRAATRRLPPELLGTIFLVLADIDRPVVRERGVVLQNGWINVLWICTDWRMAALAERKLFADNVSQLPSAVNDFLYLAGDVPLVYRVTRDTPRTASHFDQHIYSDNVRLRLLYSCIQFDKVRVLDIDSRVDIPEHLRRLSYESKARPLSHLEHLSVNERQVDDELVQEFCMIVGSMINTIHTPILRTAKLWNTWTPLDAPKLEILSVVFGDKRCPRPRIFTLLEGLVLVADNLRELTLLHCVRPMGRGYANPVHVRLPRLEMLRVAGWAPIAAEVLSALSWPVSAHVTVQSSLNFGEESSFMQLKHLSQFLVSSTNRMQMIRVSYDVLHDCELAYFTLHAWDDTCMTRERSLDEDIDSPNVTLDLEITLPAVHWMDALRSVVQNIGASSVRVLALTMDSEHLADVHISAWSCLFLDELKG